MQEYRKTFRIPFTKDELYQIAKLSEKECLKKTTFVTQKLMLALKDFKERNQFGVSLNFTYDKNGKVLNPKYVQLYIGKSDYEELKRYCDLTGMNLPQFTRYLFMQQIQRGEEIT